MSMKKILQFLAFLALPLIVGGFAGFATSTGVSSWYVTLEKPFFNPPNWLFGPVWTILYTLMGVSSYMVWRSAKSAFQRMGMDLYFTQLALNFTWSFVFFAFQSPGWALINIVLLWIFILYMIIYFIRTKPVAGYLQIPYLLWVSFATLLNGAIWWLN